MKRTLLPLTLLSAALVMTGCARHYDFAKTPKDLYNPDQDIEAPVAYGWAGALESYDFQMAQRHEALLFETGKHDLTHAHMDALNAIVADIETLNEYEVTILGHTDSKGSDGINEEISLRRAESVVAYLVSRSVPMARISVASHAKRKQPVGGDSDWRHPQNRRVDVLVTPVR